MSVQPRTTRELIGLMTEDPRLLDRVKQIVRDADEKIEDQLLDALKTFLHESDVSVALMSHPDVTKAIKTYYRDQRLDGNYVKLW